MTFPYAVTSHDLRANAEAVTDPILAMRLLDAADRLDQNMARSGDARPRVVGVSPGDFPGASASGPFQGRAQ
jgi:hypothetical protein